MSFPSFESILLPSLCGIAFLACQAPQPGPEPAESVEGKRTVSVSPALLSESRVHVVRATRKPLGGTIVASGQVVAEPNSAADVTAAVTARVRSISVRLGDIVKQGAPLAELEAGEIARVTSDLERARARLAHAERVEQQERELMARGATSARDLSDANSELAAAKADVRAATSLLQSYGVRADRRFVLRAPIAGTVVRVNGVVGAAVDPLTALFRLVDTQALLVRADVPESEADLVPERAEATIRSLSKATNCSGLVESHAPAVDSMTRTVPFRVQLSKDCGHFHEGAFVDVAIERTTGEKRKLVALPRDAVVNINEVPVVFVQGKPQHTFTARPVRVSRYTGPIVFIEDGVNEGEAVADRGAILLKGELMRAELE